MSTLSKETRDSSNLTIAKKRITMSRSMLRQTISRIDFVEVSSTIHSLSTMKRSERRSIRRLTTII